MLKRYFSDPAHSWASGMMLNVGAAGFIFPGPVFREQEREAGRKGAEESEQLSDKQRNLCSFLHSALQNQGHSRTLPTPEMLSLSISFSPLWNGLRQSFCCCELHIPFFPQTTFIHTFLSSFSPETLTLM